MKNFDMSAQIIIDILQKQILVLTSMLEEQKVVRSMVNERKWTYLEEKFYKINSLGGEFTSLEARRIALLKELSGNVSSDMYKVSVLFSSQIRAKVNEDFRAMKKLLLLSKIENDSLHKYVECNQRILKGVFEEIVPEIRTKIYSRKGDLVSRDPESLVINHSF